MTPSRQRDVRYLGLDLARGDPVSRHRHGLHQLLRVDAGALAFTHRDASWVIPTGGTVWLPAGLEHRLEALQDAQLAILYVRPRARDRFVDAGPVETSALLRELMRVLSRPIGDAARRKRLELVVRDELTGLMPRMFVVALPVDPPARAVALDLLAGPADDRSLTQLAAAAGSSPRTLQRRFRAETGCSFQTWRRRAGLQHAMTALERGHTVSEVAHACGFSSASSFIAAFRAEVGTTPGAWRRAG